MKYLLLLTLITIFLSSCKKEVTCYCTYIDGSGYFASTYETKSYKKEKKVCDETEHDYNREYPNNSVLCELIVE